MDPLSRRRFLQSAALGSASLALPPTASASGPRRGVSAAPIRPRRLREGDTLAILAPAGIATARQVERAQDSLGSLGLESVVGEHALDRHGYLAGTDRDRAADVMRAFTDPDVDGILALRGGWGCARMLPFLDWTTIRANPKPLIGFSDLTSLLLAMYARAGLVGFHGPTGVSSFSPVTTDSLRATVFARESGTIGPMPEGQRLRAIRGGVAEGPLVGGNLTVLAAMVGTPYVPSFEGHILFLEDIGESVYRVDRMLTQLALAGLLGGLAGVVMGDCRGCGPEQDAIGTFVLDEVLEHHFGSLGIPVVDNAPIGHITDKWTVPLGVRARLDADAGALTLLEPATT